MPFILTGSDVATFRHDYGVTQRELADALGYKRQSISYWEHRPQQSIPRTQYERLLDFIETRIATADAQRTKANRYPRWRPAC
jgi:DNA-binding transcriptional regulator YiaG